MIKKRLTWNNRRHSVFSLIVLFVMTFAAVCFSLPTSASALDNLLELDADVCDDWDSGDDADVDDWNVVLDEDVDFCGTKPDDSEAFVTTGRVNDPDNPADTSYFKTGSSKDIQDVWEWDGSGNSAPAKDEITNAYAAGYLNGSGELIIYFGLDRYANNGDSTVGFWFFKDDVTYDPATKSFDGVHEVGDILVVSDFTQGGAVGSILVFEWVGDKNGDSTSTTDPGAGGGDGPLQLILIQESYDGAPGTLACGGGGNVCAIVNYNEADAWSDYYPKKGTDGVFPTGSFFEGGINISALFPLENPCFSSFMAETRASTSPTATLKDFTIHEFEVCGLEVEKLCIEPAAEDTSDYISILTDYTVTITSTGPGMIYDVTLEEISSTLDSGETCGIIEITAPGSPSVSYDPPIDITSTSYEVFETLYGEGEVIVRCDTYDNPFSNTVQITAGTTDGGSDLEASDSAVCAALAPSANIVLTKTCQDIELVPQEGDGPFVIKVSNRITVGNPGDSDEALVNITVSDNRISNLQKTGGTTGTEDVTCAYDGDYLECDGLLLPGETITLEGDYVASGNATQDPQIVVFSNTVNAVADGSLSGNPYPATPVTANCPLCVEEE